MLYGPVNHIHPRIRSGVSTPNINDLVSYIELINIQIHDEPSQYWYDRVGHPWMDDNVVLVPVSKVMNDYSSRHLILFRRCPTPNLHLRIENQP